MPPYTHISPISRTGFHYYPDSLHYRQADLEQWAPELQALGASWLVLQAPAERAIPEAFIQGLREAGVEPVLHFDLPLASRQSHREAAALFENYARWGVRYAVLFDRPNLRQSWPAAAWTQADLVEQFMDQFLPLAEAALERGLHPVFPALAPGGDYWDLAFLKASLLSLQRRSKTALLENLVLGCEAWAGNRPLDWGAGGPERWPQSRPYYTPAGSQDQRGFHIFDWYLATAQAALGKPLPVLILRGGSLLGDQTDPSLPAVDEAAHAERNLALVQLLAGSPKAPAAGDTPTPEQVLPAPSGVGANAVIGACFWLLTAAGGPHASQAWFHPNGDRLPVVEAVRQWVSGQGTLAKTIPPAGRALIRHYLLLPRQDAGLETWQLERLAPFIRSEHPTTGFSIHEASLADRVTVAGGVQVFPEETLERLRRAGCAVERILPDGTLIATSSL